MPPKNLSRRKNARSKSAKPALARLIAEFASASRKKAAVPPSHGHKAHHGETEYFLNTYLTYDFDSKKGFPHIVPLVPSQTHVSPKSLFWIRVSNHGVFLSDGAGWKKASELPMYKYPKKESTGVYVTESGYKIKSLDKTEHTFDDINRNFGPILEVFCFPDKNIIKFLVMGNDGVHAFAEVADGRAIMIDTQEFTGTGI